MTKASFEKLIKKLSSLSKENEWVEFKRNNARPDEIGENISALSNSSALLRKQCGYIIWGIDGDDHALIGTNFLPHKTKVGNE